MMINFKNLINKINKLSIKNSKNFFRQKKILLSLIKNNKLKKIQDNLNSSQVKKKVKKTFSPNLQQLYFIYNFSSTSR